MRSAHDGPRRQLPRVMGCPGLSHWSKPCPTIAENHAEQSTKEPDEPKGKSKIGHHTGKAYNCTFVSPAARREQHARQQEFMPTNCCNHVNMWVMEARPRRKKQTLGNYPKLPLRKPLA